MCSEKVLNLCNISFWIRQKFYFKIFFPSLNRRLLCYWISNNIDNKFIMTIKFTLLKYFSKFLRIRIPPLGYPLINLSLFTLWKLEHCGFLFGVIKYLLQIKWRRCILFVRTLQSLFNFLSPHSFDFPMVG